MTRRWYQKNRRAVLNRARRYYKRNRARVLKRAKKYHEANRDRNNARSRERYKRNRKKHNAYQKRWYRKNRKRALANNRRYNSKNYVCTSVRHHYNSIHNNTCREYPYYRGMPFEDGWNPDKGGSFMLGQEQILADIGSRPTKTHSLHIVNHARGFVRGNLAWADGRTQQREQLHKINARQSHRIAELEAESRCHQAMLANYHGLLRNRRII